MIKKNANVSFVFVFFIQHVFSHVKEPLYMLHDFWQKRFPVASLKKPAGRGFQQAGTFTALVLIAFVPPVHADTAVITSYTSSRHDDIMMSLLRTVVSGLSA